MHIENLSMLIQNPLHTPEEMREISDLAHILEGVMLGLAALIALLQARGLPRGGWQRYASPALIVIAGTFLFGYLVIPHHGLNLATTQWRFVFGDAQQRQHIVISLLLVIGGLSELGALRGRLRAQGWRLIWPAALLVVGALFLLHPQHGTAESVVKATMLHRALGALLVLAGMFGALNAMRPRKMFAMCWPIALLAAAAILLAYREPAGAYGGSHEGHSARP